MHCRGGTVLGVGWERLLLIYGPCTINYVSAGLCNCTYIHLLPRPELDCGVDFFFLFDNWTPCKRNVCKCEDGFWAALHDMTLVPLSLSSHGFTHFTTIQLLLSPTPFSSTGDIQGRYTVMYIWQPAISLLSPLHFCTFPFTQSQNL